MIRALLLLVLALVNPDAGGRFDPDGTTTDAGNRFDPNG
jgi:hypothetical protein